MSESDGGMDSQRFSKIWKAVHRAKELGIQDRGQRREAVIDARSAQERGMIHLPEEDLAQFPSVAHKDIRLENEDEMLTAANKYFNVVVRGNNNTIIDAVHATAPNTADIGFVLKEKGLSYEPDQIEIANKRMAAGLEPMTEIEKQIKEIRIQGVDGFTKVIAESVGEKTDSSTIIAKKSQRTADDNRPWFNRGDVNKRHNKLNREYSRSIRASHYQVLRTIFLDKRLLGNNEKLINPNYRFAFHGMVGKPGLDIVVGGSINIVDTEVVDEFANLMQQECDRRDLSWRVKKALSSDPETYAYAAKYTGADAYRQESSNPNEVQHPAFGKNFENLQIEIAAHIRRDKKKRTEFIDAVSNVINAHYGAKNN